MNTFQRWFAEVWNEGRSEVIDELLSPDCIGHGLLDANGQEVRGPENFKEFYTAFRSAFPDIHVAVEETLAERDKVVGRCRVTATHTGFGLGFPPTGRKVSFTGMCMMRLANGKIAESWNSFDFLGLYQQLGVIPAMAGS